MATDRQEQRSPRPPVDENQMIAERRAKLAALRARGNAYPNDFRRDALAGELHAHTTRKTNAELEADRRSRRGGRPNDAEARDG